MYPKELNRLALLLFSELRFVNLSEELQKFVILELKKREKL